MMKWYHECLLDWMKLRQTKLTASDIKELLPVTKTGRKRNVTDLDRIKVFAKKCVSLTQEDCISTGVMARGHLLEPYAIEAFNDKLMGFELYHWDDIVVSYSMADNVIGYSPDAMTIPCPTDTSKVHIIAPGSADPISLGEVKCYSPDKHLVCANTDKMELDERWQIATAMYATDSIKDAALILFNPKMDKNMKMFCHKYDRDDLSREIEMICEVEEAWLDFVDTHMFEPGMDFKLNEEDIILEIEDRNRLNP